MEAGTGLDSVEPPPFSVPRLQLSIRDFDLLGVLGEGGLSTVYHARRRETGEELALKVIDKTFIHRHKMVNAVIRERRLMEALCSDFVVQLLFTFQDSQKLYMALELMHNGDLFEQLRLRSPLPLEDVRHYAAELVQLLHFLRSRGVVFRDFKPENLLLDARGHLKLTDFGCAKFLEGPAETVGGQGEQESSLTSGKPKRVVTFVGTADYICPEILNNTGCSYSADLWGLGCVIFQMITSKPPFRVLGNCRDGSEYLIMERIAARDVRFPETFPVVARDLVERLLTLDPNARLGASDLSELRGHDFFHGVDWDGLRCRDGPAWQAPVREPLGDADAWELRTLQDSVSNNLA